MSTITAANSVFTISFAGIFDAPIRVEGFASDDAFSTDPTEQVETVQGIDGNLSAGFVYNPTDQTITIMPDSPSYGIFDTVRLNQLAAVDVFQASGTIYLPSIGLTFYLTQGYLISGPALPSVKKLLQPMPFKMRWGKIIGAQI